jgi:hypothetical protein
MMRAESNNNMNKFYNENSAMMKPLFHSADGVNMNTLFLV